METRAEKIENFLRTIEVENLDLPYLLNYIDIEDLNSFDDIVEALDNAGMFNVDIVYYASAMDYLKQNDPSLNECMRIASEFGYPTERLNSELLASLLASETVREEFYEYQNEIEEFFNELENEVFFSIGDSVEVPDPEDSDIHNHSFVGTILSFRNENAIVEDGEGGCFEIEVERLTLI